MATNERISYPVNKDTGNPDVSKVKLEIDKSKSERKRKYMDEENQDDYEQFKDFKSNDKGFWR
jgi:hypothetical protein